jgi:cobalt-zinc-cadmium efflux system outer membrane protein
MKSPLLLVPAVALAGCATVPRTAGYDRVAHLVEERTGEKTIWERGTPEDAEVSRRVAELLKHDLTERAAVQIALLNNPELQAAYEELGVAQADLVQAGLLKNPSLDLSIRFPETAAAILNPNVELVMEFLGIFFLPMRKKLAEAQFESAQLRLANEVFQVTGKVRQQLYTLQAAQQLVELRRKIVQAAAVAAGLAERQRKAGNIGELELETQRGAHEQARLDLAREELELELDRERLTRLLGLWGPQTEWKISAPLPALPDQEPALDRLESLAISRRLDVARARQDAATLEQALAVAGETRFLSEVEVGVDHEAGAEPGVRVIGPTFHLELPIFDQRQAHIARLEAQQRQARRRLEAISVDARSEVRAARLGLIAQRQAVEHYRKVLLPIRERTVAFAQQRYNAMLLGVFQLLDARQAEIEGYRQYIEAVRDYWIARVELERAAGGHLPESGEEKTR